MLVVSRLVPPGHLVTIRVPDGTSLRAQFHAEPEPRDITPWSADLLLIGMGALAERANGEAAEAAEQVEVGTVEWEGPDVADVVAAYAFLPQRTGYDLTPQEALDAIRVGIGVQLTSGVAHDVALAAEDAIDLTEVDPENEQDLGA